MYFWRSITTTADPLSAGLIMMSLRERKEFKARRASLGRLSWGLWLREEELLTWELTACT